MEYYKQFEKLQETILLIQDFLNLQFKIKYAELDCKEDEKIYSVTADGYEKIETKERQINFELESDTFLLDDATGKRIKDFILLNGDLDVKLSTIYSEENNYYNFILNIKNKQL